MGEGDGVTEAVVVALIAAGASVVCEVIISEASKKKAAVEDAKREQKISDRLDSIETKLDIHNGYAEKFTDIQLDIAVIKNDIKNMKGE